MDFFKKYLVQDFKDIIKFSTTENTNQIDVNFNILSSGNYNLSLPMVIDKKKDMVYLLLLYI